VCQIIRPGAGGSIRVALASIALFLCLLTPGVHTVAQSDPGTGTACAADAAGTACSDAAEDSTDTDTGDSSDAEPEDTNSSWTSCRGPLLPLRETLGLAALLAVLYWLGSVTVRWNRIAKPTREQLRAQLASLDAKFDLLSDAAQKQPLKELIQRARALIDPEGGAGLGGFADVLFWSRGKELAGWGYVHEVEVQMAAMLPMETVDARMRTHQAKLKTTSDPVALALADALATALDPAKNLTLPQKQALLAEALELNYERADTSFAYLLSWQNKAAWLVALGLLLILVLAGIDPGHSVFLLIGAVGGLLSRLSRSLERAGVQTDYGASWATLFLSPVAGALGAWSGCLFSALAVNANLLGATFKDLWSCPPTILALSAALAFGFSERLFSGILGKLTEKTVGPPSKPDPKGSALPQTPTPTPAGARAENKGNNQGA
jgi:hypothetical protein